MCSYIIQKRRGGPAFPPPGSRCGSACGASDPGSRFCAPSSGLFNFACLPFLPVQFCALFSTARVCQVRCFYPVRAWAAFFGCSRRERLFWLPPPQAASCSDCPRPG